MSDKDYEDAFRVLSGLLRKHKLNWVLRIAAATIEDGKDVVVEMNLYEEEVHSGARPTSPIGVKKKRLSSEAFNAKEKLEILVEAIDRCVVEPAFMAGDILDAFDVVSGNTDSQLKGSPFRVAFVSPQTNVESYALDRSEVKDRLVQARQLRELLGRLKGKLGDAD